VADVRLATSSMLSMLVPEPDWPLIVPLVEPDVPVAEVPLVPELELLQLSLPPLTLVNSYVPGVMPSCTHPVTVIVFFAFFSGFSLVLLCACVPAVITHAVAPARHNAVMVFFMLPLLP
jgi:hypothetical protein